MEEGCTIGESAAAGLIVRTQLSTPSEGSTKTTTVTQTKKGKYSNLKEPKTVGPRLKTTSAQRKRILEQNKKNNNGQLTDDVDGTKLNPPKRNLKGQKADMNQAEVDHIKAKSKGGSNSNENLSVRSKKNNIIKRDKDEEKR